MRVIVWTLILGAAGCAMLAAAGRSLTHAADVAAPQARTSNGLLALYDFASDDGPVIHDRAGTGTPLDLHIADMSKVQRTPGQLTIVGDTVIRSDRPATQITDAVRRSGELTIEAWLQPASTDQQGPARIVTISRDTNQRNVTLGQDGHKFDVRLRTTGTSANGLPSVSTKDKTLEARLTHVVYTRSRNGRTQIYIDGQPQADQTIEGQPTNWDGDFQLALANELSGGRPWLGTLHLVAVYDRALSPQTVTSHFKAGPNAAPAAAPPARTSDGLLALYDFASDDGPVIHDRAGTSTPLDLHIADMTQVERSPGQLTISGATTIRSERPARQITEAVRHSGELSIEAWLQPAGTDQEGPARIVTLSRDTNERNVTLGQDGRKFDVRLRTDGTSNNGLPSVSTPDQSLKARLTHVVYTRNHAGRTIIYLDGKPQAEQTIAGQLNNWDDAFHLALGNELSGDRPWKGTLHLVAIYSQALSPQAVLRNFQAGPSAAHVGQPQEQATRVRSGKGLLALYDFAFDDGPVIHDRAGTSTPLDLHIADMSKVQRTPGQLTIVGETTIRSDRPATQITEAVRRSGEITIEAWLQPANTDQQGPARIVTLSKDPNERNVTLGQDGHKYDVRLRTTSTSNNGQPSVSTKDQTLEARLTHVVYTRNRNGRTQIYLDGKQQAEQTIEGQPTNWAGDFQLALANEVSGGRPWLGTLHLVAIYDHHLSPQTVMRQFQAGPTAGTLAQPEEVASMSPQEQQFRDHIAPLLSQHCIECHDTAVKAGGLDLSRMESITAGGENGAVLVANDAAASRLWEAVDTDEMPLDRPPLSAEEKAQLRQWIDDGAVWSGGFVDPAVYTQRRSVAQNWLRRLTVQEYIATVRDTVDVDISHEARELLPPDLRADGFNNTAYNLGVDLKHVEAYGKLAETVVTRMNVADFAARFSKIRRMDDDNKETQKLIEKMGKWVLRGPLSDVEVTTYRGIATTVASAGGDFDEAVSYVLLAMLQSPRFLYRIENQKGDGSASPVTPYELASRLSYILWGGPPDKKLMQAADEGALYDPEQVEAHARRMLADPRAIEHSKQFISQWLNLNGLRNLAPSHERFPHWKPELADDMREETLAFFEEIVWKQQRPLADLLNAQVTFLTPRLAQHYGLTPQAEGDSRYDLTAVPARGGLLTQGSVLTVGGDDASMVSRGLFVMHDLLRGVVKNPPPCVDTTPVPSKPGLTQRSVAETRLANHACSGCHAKFEPLAFGLEKYDGLGTFHEADEFGNALRSDGNILFPGTGEPIPFQTSAELMDLLAGSDRVHETLTWKLTQFALGRPLTAADAPAVARIHESAQQAGGKYTDLMTAIVLSDLVEQTTTEPTP